MDRDSFLNRLRQPDWQVDPELTPEILQAYSDRNKPEYWEPHVVLIHDMATRFGISKLELDTWMFTPGQWVGETLSDLGIEDEAVNRALADVAKYQFQGHNPYVIGRKVIDSVRATRAVPVQT